MVFAAITSIVLLSSGVTKEQDFVKFMNEVVFPNIKLPSRRNLGGTKHELLRAAGTINGQSQYLWLILGEMVAGPEEPQELLFDVTLDPGLAQDLRQKIESYGTILWQSYAGTYTPPALI